MTAAVLDPWIGAAAVATTFVLDAPLSREEFEHLAAVVTMVRR